MTPRIYKGNFKGLFFICIFRISNFCTATKFTRIIGFPIRWFYLLFVNWILGIDIPDTTEIGRNLIIWHGIGLIVHPDTKIGDNVVLRQNTTIGNSISGGGAPTLGNGCNIGANSVVIGKIKVGEYAVVGAGSVVIKDVLPYSVVAGNPAKVINYKKNNTDFLL